jgi:hypothetical protein
MNRVRRRKSGRLTLLLSVPVLISTVALAEPHLERGDLPNPAAEAVVPMPLLVEALSGWVAADLGLPLPQTPPVVAYVDAADMKAVRSDQQGRDGGAAEAGAGLVAFYNLRTGTIHLPADWTGGSAGELSILVHELVHHFQRESGQSFACPAEREADAFGSQERWLARFGETLEEAFGIEPLARLVMTRCMF